MSPEESAVESAVPTPIRVLVAGLPGLISQLVVQLVQSQADMALVAPADDVLDVMLAASESDVVVMAATQEGALPPICTHLLQEYPHLRVLAVTSSGDKADLYWLGLRQQKLGVLSQQTLAAGIRKAFYLNQTSTHAHSGSDSN